AKLKFAKVTPIHKGKSKLEIGNYRPISILPIFSKILEKLMNARMTKFLNKNKIIFKHQYGFQENKCTSSAILDLQSQLINNIEKKLFSCCVFLDFSKAFDTVNHEILLQKLEHYGFRGIAYSWFKSYLHKRTQTVNINGTNAKELNVNCGVPQGSVLGPLLFLIYINDIYTSSQILQFRLFADDTSILFANKCLDALEQTINSELVKVSSWLLANKLSLNVSKSNFLLVCSRKPNRDIQLKINNTNLKQENYTKYLGVMIDEKLNLKLHLKQINLKLSKGIGILYKLRHLVPKETLKTLYSSFIQSHILYGILNWGCANKTALEPIKRNLRKAIRVIDFAHHTAHSEPIFKRLKIFNFVKLYTLETAKIMFEINKDPEEF
ncbi:MAG: reverse transcriptase family protein, partial [Flavobacteriaceae bacterium]|nr:reverse transcriptase family protein [Flavobacteriaceae bacterium]